MPRWMVVNEAGDRFVYETNLGITDALDMHHGRFPIGSDEDQADPFVVGAHLVGNGWVGLQ